MTAGDSPFLGALYALQESPFALWVTESAWALFFCLIVHTICMGFLAGTGGVLALRVLGFARAIPLQAIRALPPLMWIALGFVIVSGVFLVVGYPAKALTNPVFYVKLALAGTALTITAMLAAAIRRRGGEPGELPGRFRLAAGAAIGCWALAITAGRFLAYTAKVTLLAP